MANFNGSLIGALRTFFGKDRGDQKQTIGEFAD